MTSVTVLACLGKTFIAQNCKMNQFQQKLASLIEQQGGLKSSKNFKIFFKSRKYSITTHEQRNFRKRFLEIIETSSTRVRKAWFTSMIDAKFEKNQESRIHFCSLVLHSNMRFNIMKCLLFELGEIGDCVRKFAWMNTALCKNWLSQILNKPRKKTC